MPWDKEYTDRGDGFQEKNNDNGQKLVQDSGTEGRHPHVHFYADGDFVVRDAGGSAWGSNEHTQNVNTAAAASIGADFNSDSNSSENNSSGGGNEGWGAIGVVADIFGINLD